MVVVVNPHAFADDLQHIHDAEWIITLGVDNALDWQYEAIKGFPAPGRTIFATATKRF